MTKFAISLLGGACAVCAGFTLSSCSDAVPFIGSWAGNAPIDMTRSFPTATSVASTVAVNFLENQQKADGPVTLSSTYDIIKSPSDSSACQCDMHLVATASVNGSWTYDVDDHDDLLLTFDLSTVKVDIAPENVTVTGVADASQQQLDSIKASAITMWTGEVTRVFRQELSRYSVVDDIEVSKDGRVMTFEIESPETKLHFRRIEP